jgi:hypothetical protein
MSLTLACGLGLAWRELAPRYAALVATPWGGWLLLKLGLVAGILLLAARIRWRSIPRLQTTLDPALWALLLRGAPLLDQATLDRGLTAADRRDISQLYTGAAWQREAEARVMARSTPDSYFAWVDKLCTGKLPAPVTATTPAPAPASR